jgi:hypothetical protein
MPTPYNIFLQQQTSVRKKISTALRKAVDNGEKTSDFELYVGASIARPPKKPSFFREYWRFPNFYTRATNGRPYETDFFDKLKLPPDGRQFSLFQSLFQGGGIILRQIDPGDAVFGGEDEGLRQVVTGDDLALLFSSVQKLHGAFGGGGIVQVEDADDRLVPDCQV